MFIKEISALVDKKSSMELYLLATKEAYSFLYVKLNEKRNDMFCIYFSKKLIVEEDN